MFASVAETGKKVISSLDARRATELCGELLAHADIKLGGDRPWDITVHDERLFARVLRDGSLGFGETYVDGWWDAPALRISLTTKFCIDGSVPKRATRSERILFSATAKPGFRTFLFR